MRFASAADFNRIRRTLLGSRSLRVSLAADQPSASELWITLEVDRYQHPVLLAAALEVQAGGEGTLRFARGPELVRELERIGQSVGLRPTRPRSGLLQETLDRLRASPSSMAQPSEPALPSPISPASPGQPHSGSGEGHQTESPGARPASGSQPAQSLPYWAPDSPPPFSTDTQQASDDRVSGTEGPDPTAGDAQGDGPYPETTSTHPSTSSGFAAGGRIPRQGQFHNPLSPQQFLALPATRAPEPEELARPSAFLLFRWLSGMPGTNQMEVHASGRLFKLVTRNGVDLHADVPIDELARALAEPEGSYRIGPDAAPDDPRHVARTRRVMVEVLKCGLRTFDETTLETGMASRISRSPRLVGNGQRLVNALGFPPELHRSASQLLDGEHRVEDLLQSGIGARSGWEILYLLELFRVLEWVSLRG